MLHSYLTPNKIPGIYDCKSNFLLLDVVSQRLYIDIVGLLGSVWLLGFGFLMMLLCRSILMLFSTRTHRICVSTVVFIVVRLPYCQCTISLKLHCLVWYNILLYDESDLYFPSINAVLGCQIKTGISIIIVITLMLAERNLCASG
jgi:hypothetical protein